MQKLPVLKCFAHAVRTVFVNLAIAIRISWIWYVVLLVLGIVSGVTALANPAPTDWRGALAYLPGLIDGLIQFVAFSSIAVSWHRYVLRDETPGVFAAKLNWRVWRYLGNTLLIGLAVFGISIPVFIVIGIVIAVFAGAGGSTMTAGAMVVPGAVGALGVLFAASLTLRFGVKLPAIALDRRDFRMSDAWRATKGNTLRLAGLAVLNFAVGIAVGLLTLVFPAEGVGFVDPALVYAVGLAFSLVFAWFFTMVGVGILTALYEFFVERRQF